MRKLLWGMPVLIVGCASEPQTPEQTEAAKYDQPKMMTPEEVRANEAAHPDPRKGGAVPPPPPGEVHPN